MALSLPAGGIRDAVVAITYGIVVFSILVQGTTLKALIRWRTSGTRIRRTEHQT
jgi:CPA1 family monovalent cation:H+ antiporter